MPPLRLVYIATTALNKQMEYQLIKRDPSSVYPVID